MPWRRCGWGMYRWGVCVHALSQLNMYRLPSK